MYELDRKSKDPMHHFNTYQANDSLLKGWVKTAEKAFAAKDYPTAFKFAHHARMVVENLWLGSHCRTNDAPHYPIGAEAAWIVIFASYECELPAENVILKDFVKLIKAKHPSGRQRDLLTSPYTRVIRRNNKALAAYNKGE